MSGPEFTTAGCFPADIVILRVPVEESCRGREGAAMGDRHPRGEDLGEKEPAGGPPSRLGYNGSLILESSHFRQSS